MGCGYSRSSSSSSSSAYLSGKEYDARCIRSAEATLREAEKVANEEYEVDDTLVGEITLDLQEARLDLQHAYKPTMVAAATKKIAELEYRLEMLSPANVTRQRLACVATAKATLEATKRTVQSNQEGRAKVEKEATQITIGLFCAIVVTALLHALVFPT